MPSRVNPIPLQLIGLRTDSSFTQYSDLIRELRKAVEEENFEIISSKSKIWEEELRRQLPRHVWQELYLANPLAFAVRRKKINVVRHFVSNKFLLQRPCTEALCKCYLCKNVRGDSRFHQLYASHILTPIIEWDYVVVANNTNPIDFCLNVWEAIVKSGLFRGFTHEEMLEDLHSRIEATIIRCFDCTINENEVHLLLCDGDESALDPKNSLLKISKLISAKMKKAVIHPAVQSLITTHWAKDAHKMFGRHYRESKKVPFLVRMFGYMFVYMIIVPISIVFPHPRIIRFLKSPTTVYANEALSYWIFFAVLTSHYFIKPMSVNYIICKPVHDSLQYFFGIMMLGRFLRTCDGISRLGLNYFVSPYEILQSISSAMYITGFTLGTIAIHSVPMQFTVQAVCKDLAINKAVNKSLDPTVALEQLLSKQVNQCQAVQDFYNLGNHYIDFINNAIEPHNLSSFFLALGHLFYYLSAGNVLYMNPWVSYLNIALTRMVKDVVRWTILMILFYFAAAFAMVSLYKNYACENSKFSNVRAALFEMFWVLFALTDPDSYVMKGPLKSRNHIMGTVIEYTGFFLYATYYVFAQIVLVNLLIAIMSCTFQRIEDERILEITYWRTKIQLKYIFWHDVSALPSPFNLFYPVFWIATHCWQYVRMFRRCVMKYQKTRIACNNELTFNNRNDIVMDLLKRTRVISKWKS